MARKHLFRLVHVLVELGDGLGQGLVDRFVEAHQVLDVLRIQIAHFPGPETEHARPERPVLGNHLLDGEPALRPRRAVLPGRRGDVVRFFAATLRLLRLLVRILGRHHVRDDHG
jgi:hypothetical protein